MPIKIEARNLNFFYGSHQALFDNNLAIEEHKITAVIGPSGCGKSTHLRTYNRIFELYREQRAEGQVLLDGKDILAKDVDVLELRRKVGMIFQKPTPFPMSVFDNVAYPLRLHFKLSRREIEERVEEALRGASLWEEVKDKLHGSGLALSGGQQQRLCIARTIAAEPEVLLMDEPPCCYIHPSQSGEGLWKWSAYRILDDLEHIFLVAQFTGSHIRVRFIIDKPAFDLTVIHIIE